MYFLPRNQHKKNLETVAAYARLGAENPYFAKALTYL